MKNTTEEIERGKQLFRDFRGEEPESVEILDKPDDDVLLLVGECLGIMYETSRDGVSEKYIHKFKKSARPLLAASFDGHQLYLLNGDYTFTDAGITDNP